MSARSSPTLPARRRSASASTPRTSVCCRASSSSLVDDEVRRHGGLTEKFVGDPILAVVGIPRAHEDDAERAVRAALAMHRSFESFAAKVRAVHGGEGQAFLAGVGCLNAY